MSNEGDLKTGGPMPQAKLDDMWMAGFCAQTIRHAAGTDTGASGRVERLRFMRTHILACPECRLAMVSKNLEQDVAHAMGKLEMFERGECITGEPGFHRALKMIVTDRVIRGHLPATFFDDMRRVVRERSANPNPVQEGS